MDDAPSSEQKKKRSRRDQNGNYPSASSENDKLEKLDKVYNEMK